MRYFLEQIEERYRLEKRYKSEKLTIEEIKEMRNSAGISTIIANQVCRLNDMLNIHGELSSLMQKTDNFLKNFWKQFVAYRYSIDNNLEERSIRSMTVLRKNIMMGCSKGAELSTTYHTSIELCKLSRIMQSAKSTGSLSLTMPELNRFISTLKWWNFKGDSLKRYTRDIKLVN